MVGKTSRAIPESTVFGRPKRCVATQSMPPVSCMPAATTNSAPIDSTPGSDMPASACSGPRMPNNINTTTAPSMMMSGVSVVNVSRAKTVPTRPIVNQASAGLACASNSHANSFDGSPSATAQTSGSGADGIAIR